MLLCLSPLLLWARGGPASCSSVSTPGQGRTTTMLIARRGNLAQQFQLVIDSANSPLNFRNFSKTAFAFLSHQKGKACKVSDAQWDCSHNVGALHVDWCRDAGAFHLVQRCTVKSTDFPKKKRTKNCFTSPALSFHVAICSHWSSVWSSLIGVLQCSVRSHLRRDTLRGVWFLSTESFNLYTQHSSVTDAVVFLGAWERVRSRKVKCFFSL